MTDLNNITNGNSKFRENIEVFMLIFIKISQSNQPNLINIEVVTNRGDQIYI
jgi:hypothetical protein